MVEPTVIKPDWKAKLNQQFVASTFEKDFCFASVASIKIYFLALFGKSKLLSFFFQKNASLATSQKTQKQNAGGGRQQW